METNTMGWLFAIESATVLVGSIYISVTSFQNIEPLFIPQIPDAAEQNVTTCEPPVLISM